ncbi:MAG: hypothetical protein V4687_14520 [Bacteroidota bacterium]
MKNLIYSLTACALLLTSCKKDETVDEQPVQNTEAAYPTKIVSTYINATTTSTVNLFEFEYSAKKEVTKIKYYNSDSIYTAITYDASGRLSKLGTAKNANAIKVDYTSAGEVAKVTEIFRGAGPGGLTENFRTFEYSNGQISKTNFYYGSTVLLRSQIYTTDATGNITSAEYVQGTSKNIATFSYTDKLNPLYSLKKNPSFAFLPEGLWTNIEIILFSKYLIKEFAYTGDGTRLYSYDFDTKGRIAKISVANKTSGTVYQTFAISYLD